MTHLSNIFNIDLLGDMLEQKYVVKRGNSDNTAFIYSYTDKAVYDHVWNDVTMACRGLIVDHEGNVLARPWRKFFNSNESHAAAVDLSKPLEITDKVDGSLGILYSLNGALRVSTRGSLESEQAVKATEMLSRYSFDTSRDLLDYFTFMFEIVYPANRIILNYGQEEKLVLLGVVFIPTGTYFGPTIAQMLLQWNGPVTESLQLAPGQNVDSLLLRPNAEGIVIRQEDNMIKMKQADYLELHRAKFSLSNITIWEALCRGTRRKDFLKTLPEEFHPYVEKVWTDLKSKYLDICAEAYNTFYSIGEIPGAMSSRAAFAAEAKKHGSLTPLLFLCYDGKQLGPTILKSLRPVYDGGITITGTVNE